MLNEQTDQRNHQDDCNTPQHGVQDDPLAGGYNRDPFLIDAGEFLLVIDALVEVSEFLLQGGAIFGRLDDRRGIVVMPREPRRRSKGTATRTGAGFRLCNLQLLIERIVLGGECSDESFGFGFCAPKKELSFVQRPPLRDFMDQAALLSGSCGGRKSGFGSLRGDFVLFDHGLNAVLRITAGANQILLAIIDFILVELLLGVGDFELIFKGVLGIAGGFRDGCGQLRYLCLVAGQVSFRLLKAGLDLFCFVTEWWRMLGYVAECGGERDVHFVIGEPQGLLRMRALFRKSHKGCEFLSGFEWGLIDGGLIRRGGAIGRGSCRSVGKSDRRWLGAQDAVAHDHQ